jgi:hypothetical protein
MSKRKIAGCVNVRIRAGDYQHIEVVKYAEEEIDYTSKEDIKVAEDALNADLIDCMLRSLKATADKLGKGKAEAIEVEQTLSKAIPEWLANDPVPNIANGAKKVLNTVADKQKVEKDKAAAAEKDLVEGEAKLTPKVDASPVEQTQTVENKSTDDVGDLFENDPTPVKAEVADVVEPTPVPETKKETKKEDDGFDIFADSEDLFGGK